MNIRIHSYLELCNLLEAEPGQHDCIMICGSDDRDNQQRARREAVEQHARNHLLLTFDDVTWKGETCISPAPDHVREALSWSQGRENVIVACAAGVSRSSATAYILACSRLPAQAAINILDRYRHWPNEWVVRFGAEALARPEVWTVFEAWQEVTVQVRCLRRD